MVYVDNSVCHPIRSSEWLQSLEIALISIVMVASTESGSLHTFFFLSCCRPIVERLFSQSSRSAHVDQSFFVLLV